MNRMLRASKPTFKIAKNLLKSAIAFKHSLHHSLRARTRICDIKDIARKRINKKKSAIWVVGVSRVENLNYLCLNHALAAGLLTKI